MTGTCELAVRKPDRVLLLKQIRDGELTVGEIITIAETLAAFAKQALEDAENRQNLETVNDFLLDVRKHFWEAA
jgi:aminoglycoside phosphotransferase family enzyme